MIRSVSKRLSLLILLLVLALSSCSGAKALSPEQTKLLQQGVYYYNLDACSGVSASNQNANEDAPDGPVFILGDSIMWGGFYGGGGLDKAFDTKDIEHIVDAQGSRAIKEFPGDARASSPINKKATTGLQAVEEDRAEIKKAGRVIIELGTNQEGNGSASVFKSNMIELIKKIKSVNGEAKIYAVNFFSTGMKNRQAHNKALEEIAQKENVTIIDTTKKSFPLDSYNIHPTPEGYKTYNKMIIDGLGGASSTTADNKDIQYISAGKIPKEGIKVGASIYGGSYRDGSWYIDNDYQIGLINSGKKKASDFDAKVGSGGDDVGIGNRDNPLSGTTTYAELSNGAGNDFSALGDLPNGTKLEISYKGKSIIAEKGDVGAGGGNVKGKPRAIDLWWETLRLLDPKGKTDLANGTDVVGIRVVPKSTPVTPVSGAANDAGTANKQGGDPSCECSTDSGESNVGLIGSSREEKALNYFVSKGFSPAQSAGIIGNLIQESNVNPKVVEGGGESTTVPPPVGPQGQPGYGIAQWTSPDRKENLKKFAESKKMPVYSLALQLDFIMEEMERGGYGSLIQDLKNIKDGDVVTKSAFLFHRVFERSADGIEGIKERADSGKSVLAKYGSRGGAANPSGNSDSVSCQKEQSSDAITGEYSLPVDKKWYTEHKDWFTKPHHEHASADIPVGDGTKVYSMTNGKVILAPVGGACGNGVFIDAGDGVVFGYCHGSDGGSVSGAKQGDTVKAGQLIMHSDNTDETGQSSGPHLHVQIKIKNTLYCPQELFVSIAEGKPVSPARLPTSGCTY